MTILGTRPAVLGLATLALYVLIAPHWIVEGDNAELAGLSALGGAAHPSGYPLYVLWLRAWSWLPAHSPAHAAAIATGILTAIEVVLVQRAARAWGARPAAASVVAALLAASPIVLRVQSQAEVFAMNGAVAAAILWLAALEGPLRGARRVVVLALVAGLGLSNHLTCALLAPVGILGVVRGLRETTRPRLVIAGLGLVALLAGLTPYAYLLVSPGSQASWGRIEGLGGLVRHVLRMDYGGPGQLSPHGAQVAATENLWALARALGRAYLWVPVVAAVVAWKQPGETRAGWLCWLASFVLAGPLFVARFNLHPAGLEAYTVSRFHLLPMVLLAIPIAAGVSWLAERTLARVPGQLVRSPVAGTLLGVVVFLGAAIATLPGVARFHTAAVERSLENTLVSLPPNAVWIGTEDILHFGTNYLQAAVGVRPDVTVVMTPQVGLSYYRERIRAKTGVDLSSLVTEKPEVPSVRIAELMLATGRPLFIDQFQANIAKSFPIYPYGAVFRVLPRGSALPSIEDVFATNKALFEKFRFDYPVPGPGDDLAAQAHAQYAATWRALAEGLTAHPDERAYAEAMARALAPQ